MSKIEFTVTPKFNRVRISIAQYIHLLFHDGIHPPSRFYIVNLSKLRLCCMLWDYLHSA